jgi:hypothetical protein
MSLQWIEFNERTRVAAHKSRTYVMTKTMAGRPNRYDLVVVSLDHLDRAKVWGRELTPGHCKRIAVKDIEP